MSLRRKLRGSRRDVVVERMAADVPGLDLGSGRVLGEEDALEGHYRRVRARIRLAAVQVSDSLIAAIGLLAPNLAPLTRAEEHMVDVAPPVVPEPEFRAHLHEALERAHRQHAAQRMLGTRPVVARRRSSRAFWLLVLIALSAALVAWWGYSRSPRAASE